MKTGGKPGKRRRVSDDAESYDDCALHQHGKGQWIHANSWFAICMARRMSSGSKAALYSVSIRYTLWLPGHRCHRLDYLDYH
jgi:hypothetical protein